MIAILMLLLLSLGDMIFELFATAVIGFLCIALLPPILTRKIWEEKLNVSLSLYHLIPVSFGTFIFPVFGASLGGPSLSEYSYWLLLIPFAALGGVFWSLPFAGWNYYIPSRNSE
ncbi:MAG: hypothetical protein VW878_06265 [Candidatus Poseidoniales archaeon]